MTISGSAVLSVAQMYGADRAAAVLGVPSLTLMEAAGAAVVREIAKRWPKQAVVILCGPGNNGGDGFVIARLLFNTGWPVRVALLGKLDALKGDALANAQRWSAMGRDIVDLEAAPDLFMGRPLVVDALFGAGLTRHLSGAAATAIGHVNAAALTCIAVDIPSGVHGDTAVVLDAGEQGGHGVAPQCALTVTFFRPKPAHVLYPGRGLCGELVVADIGIPEVVLEAIKPETFVNGPELWSLPRPDWRSHKYTRGHAVVFGSADMSGAARLAGRATRRVGAGILTYAVPNQATALYASDEAGAIVKSVDNVTQLDELLADERKNVLAVGPGMAAGPATSGLVLKLLATARPVVLDAGAITSFAADPGLLLESIRTRSAPTVLTPHEGEFRRLFQVSGSRLERARQAAAISGAVVLLKGADTVVASPDGRAVINAVDAPWLGAAGSGDVLAGLITGLLSQGLPAWHAASAAAWLHAMAGARLGAGLIAEDLPAAVASIMKNDLLSIR